jgi:hypothetical protein
MMMKIFIAGVMQGSTKGHDIQGQDYRLKIREVIRIYHPDADIVDPFSLFPDSVNFKDQRAKQVLFDMAGEAGSSDIVIAYLPEASMGTALEMTRAHDNGKTIISISPMKTNWFIRSISKKIFPTLDDFCVWAHQTQLVDWIGARIE